MLAQRSVRLVILFVFFSLVVGSSVLADDGRINRAPYHFGGDTLFCSEEIGCKLLNETGHELALWPQSDIAAAFAASDKSGQNVQVSGEGQGTYGPMQLWSVSPDATTGNNTLCMIGFDEWGKQNNMCFEVTKDYHFEQAPLPVVEVDHSCDGLFVSERVQLISNSSVFGNITAIDLTNHTVTFGTSFTSFRSYTTFSSAPVSHTAKCSEVEVGRPL